MITLVCGLPGTGKSTYAREHMGGGLVYDMDAIAGAMRLSEPHGEYHPTARKMANEFLQGFLWYVKEYNIDAVVIRTAPRINEAEEIAPDKIVILTHRYCYRPMDDEDAARERLEQLYAWARNRSITVRR